jgi:hypothetical protein
MERVRTVVKLDIELSNRTSLNIMTVDSFLRGALNLIEIVDETLPPDTRGYDPLGLLAYPRIACNIPISRKIVANVLMNLWKVLSVRGKIDYIDWKHSLRPQQNDLARIKCAE